MRINNNISALNTWRGLTQTDSAMSKSLEKLSSGLRINRAGDDAAGLAISEKMRGQIKGLNQATRNAQDGISMIQTGEGALNETHSILQRMRELSVQASSGSMTDDDRNAIQDEVNQLISEVDRIGTTTEFNKKSLLDGSQKQDTVLTANPSGLKNFSAFNAVAEGTDYNVNVANVSKAAANLNTAGNLGLQAGDITFTGGNYDIGSNVKITVADGASGAGYKNLTLTVDGVAVDTLADHDVTTGATFNAVPGLALTVAANSFNAAAGTGNGDVTFDFAMEADYTVTKGAATLFAATNLQTTTGEIRMDNFRATVDNTLVANAANTITVNGKAVEFQIGANSSQTSSLSFNDMRAAALKVANLDVNDQVSAQASLDILDAAIKTVSDERGKLGAVQNRLEHTINNLGVAAENLTAAESRVRDVDMAAEMMNMTRQNILSQAGTAMMAQANQRPQAILQLLR